MTACFDRRVDLFTAASEGLMRKPWCLLVYYVRLSHSTQRAGCSLHRLSV